MDIVYYDGFSTFFVNRYTNQLMNAQRNRI